MVSRKRSRVVNMSDFSRGGVQLIFEGNFWVLLLKIVVFSIIGISISIIIGFTYDRLKNILIPLPPPIPLGKAMMDSNNLMRRKIRQRMLCEGNKGIERFEFLLLRYQPLGLTELYNELKNKQLDPDGEEKLTLIAIENMIEDKIIKYENDRLDYDNYLLKLISQAKEI